MWTTLFTILGITVAAVINGSYQQKIAAAEEAINNLRSKNDKKSQAKLQQVSELINSNNMLRQALPRYSKIIDREAKKLNTKYNKVVNDTHDAINELNDLSTDNQTRASKTVIDKAYVLARDKIDPGYATDHYKNGVKDIESRYNLNNFEKEV